MSKKKHIAQNNFKATRPGPLPQTPDGVRELADQLQAGMYSEKHLHSLCHFAYDMSKAWQAVGARAEALWKAAVIASYAPHR